MSSSGLTTEGFYWWALAIVVIGGGGGILHMIMILWRLERDRYASMSLGRRAGNVALVVLMGVVAFATMLAFFFAVMA